MGGRKPRGTVLVFEGRRYTWSDKGYWRCTEMQNRHNLARLIWSRAHGPIPPGHKVIYLDGDRYNLAVKNLACLSHAEVQRRRLADPNYRVIAQCQLVYGHLVRSIRDKLDPSLRHESAKKAWRTRIARFGPSGGNKRGVLS